MDSVVAISIESVANLFGADLREGDIKQSHRIDQHADGVEILQKLFI